MALVFALAALAAPAYACTSNPGDRAPQLAGWDIVGQRSVSLDDYRGQWVLVEFSAAWCGPCMRQLPDLLAAVQPYRASGKLAVIMVSGDTPETLPKMKQVIKDHGIDFPVLYDGGGDSKTVPYLEWSVYGWPSTYLVDPQGVIVAAGLRGQPLDKLLTYFLDGPPRPVIGLRARSTLNSDGTISVFAELTNPAHAPLELALTRYWEHWFTPADDPTGTSVDFKQHYDKGFAKASAQCDTFGEAVYEFRLTPTAEMNTLGYNVHLLLPGTADAAGKSCDMQSQDDQAYFRGIGRGADGGLSMLSGPDAQRWLSKREFEKAAGVQ